MRNIHLSEHVTECPGASADVATERNTPLVGVTAARRRIHVNDPTVQLRLGQTAEEETIRRWYRRHLRIGSGAVLIGRNSVLI